MGNRTGKVLFPVLVIIAAAIAVTGVVAVFNRGEVDPRYDTCAEANAHNYGPYRAGKDAEYGWYEDRNHDGVVCE